MNTSNKKFEFTYDGGHYGPYIPGQIIDMPDGMAHHALRKSAILEQDQDAPNVGEIIGYQMEPLENVAKDKVKELATYTCPFVASNLCDAKPFKAMNDLKAHLESHWELAPEAVVANRPATVSPAPAARK
jgi:hypothetical protein